MQIPVIDESSGIERHGPSRLLPSFLTADAHTLLAGMLDLEKLAPRDWSGSQHDQDQIHKGRHTFSPG